MTCIAPACSSSSPVTPEMEDAGSLPAEDQPDLAHPDLAMAHPDLAPHAGSADTSFGQAGCTAFLDYQGHPANNSSPYSIAVDVNGSTFVVGVTDIFNVGAFSSRSWFVNVDSTGHITTDTVLSVGPFNHARAFPSGGLLVTNGTDAMGGTIFVHADSAGTPDPAFNVQLGDAIPRASQVGLQKSGALILLTTTKLAPGLTRANAQGALDSTFGTGGTATFPSTFQNGTWLAVDDSDRIYVAGATPSNRLAVIRYSADGVVDTSWGTGGVVDVGVALGSWVPELWASRSGNDLYIGWDVAVTSPSTGVVAIAHLTPDGFDTAFAGGATFAKLSAPASAMIMYDGISLVDGLVQDDGKLVLTIRTTSSGWFLTRLTPLGQSDTSYGSDGWVFEARHPNDTNFLPIQLALAADGGMLVLEDFQTAHNLYSEESSRICKYRP